MKILLAAVMYSPNLGDGLIAESLTARIADLHPDAKVTWLDIAGRTGFVAPSKGLRTLVLGALAQLPRPISERLAAFLVGRQISSQLEPLLPDAFEGVDGVIIGGGQLLADANLNFPLKLGRIIAEAEARNLPVAIHSVGVSSKWSPRGLAAFKQLLLSPNLVFVSVRDQASADNLAGHYKALGVANKDIQIFPDPAFSAAGLDLPVQEAHQDRYGIGIVHPAAIRTHAGDQPAPTVKSGLAQYTALIAALRAKDVPVTLFTNGSGEDEEMLDTLWESLADKTGVHRQPRPGTPLELSAMIKSFKALASHRLHACIDAHSLGTHAVGFRWDHKVDAYFALTQQQDFLFDFNDPAQDIVAALLSGRPAALDARHAELAPEVDRGVSAVLEKLAAR